MVEDEHLLAANLVDSLRRIGLEVGGVASNRADATALIEQHGFDIAFIDLFLGREYHGLDLARLASARAVAVVLVTGQLSHTISDTLASLRSAALLTKPFSIDQLRSVVDAVRQGLAKPNEDASPGSL
ncbi:MAG: response regulator [Pseudomonadota bacterium]